MERRYLNNKTMKKIYIIPNVMVVNIVNTHHLMQNSIKVDAKTVNDDDGGWVKENKTVDNESIWDNEW